MRLPKKKHVVAITNEIKKQQFLTWLSKNNILFLLKFNFI